MTAAAADPSGGLAALVLWLTAWPVTAVAVGTVALLLGGAGALPALLAAGAFARSLASDRDG